MRARLIRFALAIALIAGCGHHVHAQSPPVVAVGHHLQWDLTTDVDGTPVTPASAQAATAKLYVDGSVVGIVLTGVTCTAGADVPATCTAPLPTLASGQHDLRLTVTNPAGESQPSAELTVAFVVLLAAPSNLRVQ